jgi:hypothetical protein
MVWVYAANAFLERCNPKIQRSILERFPANLPANPQAGKENRFRELSDQ